MAAVIHDTEEELGHDHTEHYGSKFEGEEES